MRFYIFTFIQIALTVAAYFASFKLYKGQSKLIRLIIISGAIATALFVIWGNWDARTEIKEQKARYENLESKSDTLLDSLDALNSKYNMIRNSLDTLSMRLAPFTEEAMKLYPDHQIDSALKMLLSRIEHDVATIRTDVATLQPKLEFLKSEVTVNIDSLVHTSYPFRSSHPSGVSNISIDMRFDKIFVGAECKISKRLTGMLMEENCGRIDANTGISFKYDYLSAADKLIITVHSKTELTITYLLIKPSD